MANFAAANLPLRPQKTTMTGFLKCGPLSYRNVIIILSKKKKKQPKCASLFSIALFKVVLKLRTSNFVLIYLVLWTTKELSLFSVVHVTLF